PEPAKLPGPGSAAERLGVIDRPMTSYVRNVMSPYAYAPFSVGRSVSRSSSLAVTGAATLLTAAASRRGFPRVEVSDPKRTAGHVRVRFRRAHLRHSPDYHHRRKRHHCSRVRANTPLRARLCDGGVAPLA